MIDDSVNGPAIRIASRGDSTFMETEIQGLRMEPTAPTGRRGRGRLRVAILTAMITAVILLASLTWLPRTTHVTYDHHYYVKVDANITGEYTLRLPVPHDANDKFPVTFIEELEVMAGEPVFSLEVFGHGLGLEVLAGGDIEFEWTLESPASSNVKYGNLTMTYGAEGWTHSSREDPSYSWICSDSNDIMVQFLYSCISHIASRGWVSGGGPTFEFFEYPSGTGWQRMPIDYGWLVIN